MYEPGRYVPLARLDAQGQATEQGGLGTTQDAEPGNTPETIATKADHISAKDQKHPKFAANDPLEAQYWEALNAQVGTAQKTGTEAKLCDVYYFHAKIQSARWLNFESAPTGGTPWRCAAGAVGLLP